MLLGIASDALGELTGDKVREKMAWSRALVI